VAGILEKTDTPVDRAVHVSLEAIEAIHVDWRSGAKLEGVDIPSDRIRAMKLEPESVTAALVGLKSRIMAFRFQRAVNEYEEEPLTAILPGVALTRLWSLIGVAERALSAISAMVVLTALIGLVATHWKLKPQVCMNSRYLVLLSLLACSQDASPLGRLIKLPLPTV